MKKHLFTLIASAAFLAGCSGNDESFVFTSPQPAQAQASVTHQQVEFLGRPAIAEGLLYTNAFLSTYNAVGPSFIAAALADPNSPQGQAAAPIFAEAVGVLDLLENADANPANGLTTNQIVGAFLPDVLRIDTTLSIAVAAPSYPTFNPAGSTLRGGRKITDDVIDITLAVLTDNAVTTDNVPYYRPAAGAGSTNASIGHSLLNGQAAPNGPAQFPFLAEPY